MPMYCGVDGAKRKITKLLIGENGAKRYLNEMWAGVDGVERKIYSSKSKKIRAWFTSDLDDSFSGEYIPLEHNKQYEIWCIGAGTHGSRGGSNWGLYKGKGGGCGSTGGVGHAKFVVRNDATVVLEINFFKNSKNYMYSGFSVFCHVGSSSGLSSLTLSEQSVDRVFSTDAENAGAFAPNPSGGYSGVCPAITKLFTPDNFVDKNYSYVCEVFDGKPTEKAYNGSRDGMSAYEPVKTPFTVPPYIAGPGQSAYYSTDLNSICLGNAGGGGNGGGQAGGAGSPGGIILIEEDI